LEYFSTIVVGSTNPAYFYGDGKEDFVVAESIEAALELAKVKTSNVSLLTSDLRQDVDALDTWFSSWLWPMSVLAELQIPKTKTSNTITQRMI
jgi:valyl-tRNA synthetase